MSTQGFDLTELNQMKAYGEFGKKVIELAKELDIIPKREKVKRIFVKPKRKVVVKKRHRRTKAQIEADNAAAAAAVASVEAVAETANDQAPTV